MLLQGFMSKIPLFPPPFATTTVIPTAAFAPGDMCRFPDIPMKVGDPRLRLTNEEHRARGDRVSKANALAMRQSATKKEKSAAKRLEKFEGCNGANPFSRLPYADLQTLCCVPAAHAGLYGVVKHFIGDILRNPLSSEDAAITLSADQKRLVKSRASDIVVTADFGRGYKCVVDYK